MQNENEQKKKENRRLVLYAVVAMIVVIIVLIISFVRPSSNDDNGTTGLQNNETETVIEETETSSYAIFQNVGFIRKTFDNSMATAILDSIQGAIIGDKNNSGTINALVDGSSISQTVYFPYTIYSMKFEISDGRNYSVGIATNKGAYCGVMVRQDGGTDTRTKLFIIFSENASASSYDRDAVIAGIINWAKNTSGGELIVSTKN